MTRQVVRQVGGCALILLAGCATVNATHATGPATFIKRSGLALDVKNLWLTAAIVEPHNVFSTEDPQVVWWAELAPFAFLLPERFVGRWYGPDGTLCAETVGGPFRSNTQYAVVSLPLRGTSAARQLGHWRVDIFWKETRIDTQAFTIGPVQPTEANPGERSSAVVLEGNGWNTYTQQEHGVFVTYPESWFQKEHSSPGIYQLFLSRERVDKPGDLFLVGISITKVYQASSRLHFNTRDLATAASIFLEAYLDNTPNPVTKYVMNRSIRVGGSQAFLSDLSFKDTFGRNARLWHVTLYANDVLTTLILEAPQTEFDRYQPIFERFLKLARFSEIPETARSETPRAPVREIVGNDVVLPGFNLAITKPEEWKLLQFDGWNSLAVFSRDDPPSLRSPLISVNAVPLLGRTLEKVAEGVALEKALQFKQDTLVHIGARKFERWGAWEGFEDVYAFSPEKAFTIGHSFFFSSRGEVAYVFTYWNDIGRFAEAVEQFHTVIGQTRLLDPSHEVSEEALKHLIAAASQGAGRGEAVPQAVVPEETDSTSKPGIAGAVS